MDQRISLNGGDWSFASFLGEDWRFSGAHRRENKVREWCVATVPGSVHWDLLRHGEIADPYYERNSRLCEWVHQRTWVYKREFTVPEHWRHRRIFLQFDGIDYAAEIFLDGEQLGEHRSLFTPACFDLSQRVRPGESHHLAVVIRPAPDEHPQIGRTSETRTTKPRMGYWWDFATRLINLGIWQDVHLTARGLAVIEDLHLQAEPSADLTRAAVTVTARFDQAARVEIVITNPSGEPVAHFETGGATWVRHTFTLERPELWLPNRMGAQPLYRCWVRAMDGSREVSDQRSLSFGIRRLLISPEYQFTVNDRPFFVRGWNWVPIDLMYGRGDLTQRYRHLIGLAQASGANLLRVWGGGLIERELFYDLCDKAGLLVWQEFQLSSSGIDNVPPDDPAYLALLEREASGVIPLRRHHACLAVWCGGNELTDADRRPAAGEEPALALLRRKVSDLDTGRHFIPTSPYGPTYDLPDRVAPGDEDLLLDVHGPWHYRGPIDTYLPYNSSTARFHSEFGAQGAVAKPSLDRFIGPAHQWPPEATNPVWHHHGAWWPQAHRVRELFGEVQSIEEYLPLSQFLQTENLKYAVESNRRRWPRCGGALVWQLNEPWPNGHNTSAVDYYLRPKMAYYAVRRAFQPVAPSLSFANPIIKDGRFDAHAWIAADRPVRGTLLIILSDPSGKRWHIEDRPVAGEGTIDAGAVEWALPAEFPEILICTLSLAENGGRVGRPQTYLFSRSAPPLLDGLRWLPRVDLLVVRESERIVVTNPGPVYALFPMIEIDDPRVHWTLADNGALLAPGEVWSVPLSLTPRTERADPDRPHGWEGHGPIKIRVAGWNTAVAELDWELPR